MAFSVQSKVSTKTGLVMRRLCEEKALFGELQPQTEGSSCGLADSMLEFVYVNAVLGNEAIFCCSSCRRRCFGRDNATFSEAARWQILRAYEDIKV